MPGMENTLNTTHARLNRIGRRVRKVVNDISYLERRKLELQSGLSLRETRRF